MQERKPWDLDLASLWRIIVAVILFQVGGGAIGVAYGYHHFAFFNLWVGGALATLPGFIIGATWHFASVEDRSETIGQAGFLGFLSVGLFLFAVFLMIPQMRSEMEKLAVVSQFDDQTIERIEIFDEWGEKRILTITEPTINSAFGRLISDAEGHSPNHPKYSQSWRVIVSGRLKYEFELHLDPDYPDSVIGDFVETNGSTTRFFGSFRSRALRKWVEEHLVPLELHR